MLTSAAIQRRARRVCGLALLGVTFVGRTLAAQSVPFHLEADGSAKAPPKSDDPGAVDESQPPPGAKGPSPQRFVPSEQVRADFDVSFPIDI